MYQINLRLYTNPDVIGVELGGSLKNVIAIASGFAQVQWILVTIVWERF